MAGPEHRNRASPFASDFRRSHKGIAGNSAVGIKFIPFNRRENRRSLAILFAEEIAHLGALKIARFCGGAVKIAAATAENRAILVHSGVAEPEPRRAISLNLCKVRIRKIVFLRFSGHLIYFYLVDVLARKILHRVC